MPGLHLIPCLTFTAILECFVKFLAMTLQGHLDVCTTIATLSSYIWTLFALFRHTGQINIPKDMHTQTMAYLASADLGDHVTLSAKHHDKHCTSTVDVCRLMDTYYADTIHFQMNCMHLQMSALMTLLTISAEWIGMIVKSNCYRGSNVCLNWKVIIVVIILCSNMLETPDITLRVTVHLLKGSHNTDAFCKAFSSSLSTAWTGPTVPSSPSPVGPGPLRWCLGGCSHPRGRVPAQHCTQHCPCPLCGPIQG